MPKLTIDGIEVEVEAGTSILQAAEQIGIEIPRFCYHDRLSVPANCRMCLVEVERERKPVPSCAMAVRDGMVVRTKGDYTHSARKGVMEMLLVNHPLDCPICDQGGECDLQDQAVAYGFDRGRYTENKRAVTDKDLGPLVKTIMTRCIHCTRCVRFTDEIAGTAELAMVSRGEESEITTFGGPLTTELSGNVIDVCPVGALTSKPYAFVARPWELKKTESIDVLDAVGANIRIDVRGSAVLRIMPRLNEEVNEEWLGDKSRFSFDGLRTRRLDRPYVRVDGKLQATDWTDALAAAATVIQSVEPHQVAALTGDLVDVESTRALKDLTDSIGTPHRDCRQDGAVYDVSSRGAYTFNSTIAGIEEADAILLVGTFPRWEAPLINARIRKRWLQAGIPVGVIGEQRDHTYPVTYIGAGAQSLTDLADGNHSFADVLKGAEKPMLIVGAGALARPDGNAILDRCGVIAWNMGLITDGWNGFNVLQLAAGRVGALDVGFLPGEGGKSTLEILEAARAGEIKVLYLLGADELDLSGLDDCTIIYQGHHGDAGAKAADIILPGAAYTEKTALYVNTEGRVQQARKAAFAPGDAREDWAILRALSGALGKPLPYDNLSALRDVLRADTPVFATLDEVTPTGMQTLGAQGTIADQPFVSPVQNYYKTDAITRASQVMTDCSEQLLPISQAAPTAVGG